MTRWHEDDLAGRLLAADAASWRVVKLAAQAGAEDPLGRAPGDWLWADDSYGYAAQLDEAHRFYQRTGGLRDWSALYQQEPRAQEGALFRTERIGFLPLLPEGPRVRAWDLAATAKIGSADPDWTVGVLMVRTGSGQFVVGDVTRLRAGPDTVRDTIRSVAGQDGPSTLISLPQDPGQAGKAQAADFIRLLAGYRVQCTPETGNKATRAEPVAAQANGGNLALVRAAWNAAYLDELRAFPGGGKDDQVDATSRAFALAAGFGQSRGSMQMPFLGR